MKIPEWLMKLVASKIMGGDTVKWEASKTKIAAVLMVFVLAINHLGPAFGFEVKIPDEVFRLLEAMGFYGLRDAIKPKV